MFERLSALDATFLDVEDMGANMHVGVVLTLDGRPLQLPDGSIDIDHIERFVAAGLHDIPRYRQRLARTPFENHPGWIDDDSFNLRYHVRHTSLPKPGTERLLKRLAGRIISQRLDRDKPLWEIWIVEGLQDDRVALIAKAHHCMVDGVAGVDVLSMLLRPSPETQVVERPPWRPRRTPSPGQIAAGEIARRTRSSLEFARGARRTLLEPLRSIALARDGAAAVRESLAAGLAPADSTPLNPERIGPHRRFDWIRFDLDEVKRIKNRLGGTVNDVVLATVAGGIGDFLQRRGTRTQGLDFRAMVPVSIRPSADRGEMGNRVAQLIAPLPVGESDPRRRLQRVIDTTRMLKDSRQTHGGEIISTLADWGMAPLLTTLMRLGSRTTPYNMVVTNVPGPQTRLYMLGAPVLEMYPVVPLFINQALGIALFSYCGELFYGINSDWDRVPDLHDFIDAMVMSFQDLLKAAEAEPAR